MSTHYQVMRPFSIIVAADEKGGIGKDGTLPWRISADLKYFKETTTKASSAKAAEAKKMNAVIMGRKTWDSIPAKFRPLEGRLNIILSSTMKAVPEEDIPNVKIVNGDLQQALTALTEPPFINSIDRVFVIGGASLYKEALTNHKLPLHHVFITRVKGDLGCDVSIDFQGTPRGFQQVSKGDEQTEGDFTFAFEKYSRINKEEQQYLDLVEDIIKNGVEKGDRTGVGTISRFGAQMRFSLRDGTFPLLTTKRVFWTGVAEELFWFIKGETDGKTLKAKGVGIWDDNGTREFLDGRGLNHREVGDLGPIYGFQWRHFGAEYGTCHDDYSGKGIDQLAEVIDKIKNNPNDRRIIMSAWNPTAMPEMALPPCHILSQFYVANGELSCQMYQRSCDMGLGVPFNIASYSLLTIILADICGLKPGDFIHTLGDAHVYSNHVEPLKTQLERNPRPFPVVKIVNHHDKVEDYCMDDFAVLDYAPMPTIKMQMAV